MKKFLVWVIAFQLCNSEFSDYSDYHPKLIPFQSASGPKSMNPSPEYNVVMRNLCNNWQSPISYLKERGYMPTDSVYKPKAQQRKNSEHRNEQLSKGDNYFFFPEKIQPRSGKTFISSEENENPDLEFAKTELPKIESSNLEASSNDTEREGIVDKVKNKFLSIFSHKDKNNKSLFDEKIEFDDPQFLENYDDDENSDRRLFARSLSEKTRISSNFSVLSNLTESEIHFIKSFIDWFKQYKSEFKFLSPTAMNMNTTTPAVIKSMPDETNQNKTKATVQSTTASESENKAHSSTQPTAVSITSDCSDVTSTSSKTSYNNQHNETAAKNKTSSSGGKGVADDFTVDLDINQKNGTGEEVDIKEKCICAPVITTNSSDLPSNKYKFVTKSKFLAHLHHMVDEVGKPPHKPLDLSKVQEIIDKSKHPTVILSGGKTTQCTPLQLNDMSFDLEWNKINQPSPNSRDKLNILDLSYENHPQEQSLAAKFLQETNLNSDKSNEYLKTPYADNFLDSQQSLPNDLELPVKISTKREAVLPSFGKNMDMSLFPDNEGAADYLDDDKGSAKRRIKGRLKGRGRKKPKHKHDAPFETADIDLDSQDSDPDVFENSNNFDNFDELKDIQFRVSDSDEEAISTFISNLNSPPEVFSFDVDKYLRSAKQEIEPKTPEFDYQTPEPRTYYEFMESPAVEKEQLPIIEAPLDSRIEPTINKRSRKTNEKRDLLRQYIKGVSSALNHNFPEISASYKKIDEDKPQRSPNLDTDISIRTNNLIDGFSTQLDAMDSIKSKDGDDSINNFFLLNDGSAIEYETQKKNTDLVPNDYSPQSLEIDLDLNKKFRDLNIGQYDSKNDGGASDDSKQVEANDVEYV